MIELSSVSHGAEKFQQDISCRPLGPPILRLGNASTSLELHERYKVYEVNVSGLFPGFIGGQCSFIRLFY